MSKERNYAANVYEMMMQQQQPIVVTPPHHQISTQTLCLPSQTNKHPNWAMGECVKARMCLHYPRLTKKQWRVKKRAATAFPLYRYNRRTDPVAAISPHKLKQLGL
jgi:hypothetical protein